MVFFSKNQSKSLQKPLYTNFGLTYIDVFFDEESESDVIFDIKLTPKGLKSSFFIESRFLKIGFLTKNRFFAPLGVNFMSKIASDSNSSSKNMLIKVIQNSYEVVFGVIYCDCCKKKHKFDFF